jgi:microcystin-dependent protein
MAVDVPFLGEIRLMSFNFPPSGWAMCNGQLLLIAQNIALFHLLDTRYGGNGTTTFALPDLRGRVPIHRSTTHALGERGGEEAHTLTIAEMPMHTHIVNASSAPGTRTTPAGSLLAKAPSNAYGKPARLTTMANVSSASIGGSQAHLNMQPFLVLTFCIALQGTFPASNASF